jgi:hypothetical protein
MISGSVLDGRNSPVQGRKSGFRARQLVLPLPFVAPRLLRHSGGSPRCSSRDALVLVARVPSLGLNYSRPSRRLAPAVATYESTECVLAGLMIVPISRLGPAIRWAAGLRGLLGPATGWADRVWMTRSGLVVRWAVARRGLPAPLVPATVSGPCRGPGVGFGCFGRDGSGQRARAGRLAGAAEPAPCWCPGCRRTGGRL